MNQQARLYCSVSLENSVKQLKYCLARATREVKHSACGLDANKAPDKAECFISIEATRLVLYFTYSIGMGDIDILARDYCKASIPRLSQLLI